MCHTSQTTHMLCMHTSNTKQPCTFSQGFPSPSLFSLFHSQSKCKPTIGGSFFNDFCFTCQQFWEQMVIKETEARHRTIEYRQRTNYRGALMPFPGDEVGVVHFFREDFAHSDREVRKDKQGDDEAKYLSQLNSWWISGDEEMLDGIEQPVLCQGSPYSMETVWPTARNTPEMDIGELSLDGLVELDEFGAKIEVPVPRPTVFARDRYIHPDEFELVNLPRPLPGLVNHEGFERQKVTRPVGPFPEPAPQRKADEGSGQHSPEPGDMM